MLFIWLGNRAEVRISLYILCFVVLDVIVNGYASDVTVLCLRG